MVDRKLWRGDPGAVAANLARRGFVFDAAAHAALEKSRKALQVRVEELRNERNVASKGIGRAKAAGEDIQPLLAAVESLGDALKSADDELAVVRGRLDDIEAGLPNLLHESVPDGAEEEDNVQIRAWGEPATPAFEVRDHVDLGAALGQLDFDVAAKLTGARFGVMRGGLASLHRALTPSLPDRPAGHNASTGV